MSSELIIITEYCSHSNIEEKFISLLESEGLIELQEINGQDYISTDELSNLEKYARWYYDLSINIEGIDAIRMLLKRMEDMQSELDRLKRLVSLDSNEDSFDFDNDLFN